MPALARLTDSELLQYYADTVGHAQALADSLRELDDDEVLRLLEEVRLGIPVPRPENDQYWRLGLVYHLLTPMQQGLYDAYKVLPGNVRKAVTLVTRRGGKTVLHSGMALEKALQKPGSVQQYAAPTAKQVKAMLLPVFRILLDSCPEDMRPKWRPSDGLWLFSNTSEVHVAGCEDERKADRLRGAFSDNFFVDEAGYVPVLRYVVDLATPMLHRRPGARLYMYSNAPRTPAHDIVEFIREAKRRGAYQHRSIYDADLYSQKEIDEFADECGGKGSTAWKREYLCEIVADEDLMVVPEWTPRAEAPWVVDLERRRVPGTDDDWEDVEIARAARPDDEVAFAPLVREVERPQYFDIYTSMDLGWRDLTSVLFAYWDFAKSRLVVENELELSRMTTDELADGVWALEQETWGGYWDRVERDHGWARKPFRRVMDVDPQIQCDLSRLHHLSFVQANNQDLHSQINQLRQLIKAGKLVVHPRCRNLRAHLAAAYWNSTNTAFARPSREQRPGEVYWGHFDHVSSVQLLNTHLAKKHNPFPALPVGVSHDTHWIRPEAERGRAGWDKLAQKMTGRRG